MFQALMMAGCVLLPWAATTLPLLLSSEMRTDPSSGRNEANSLRGKHVTWLPIGGTGDNWYIPPGASFSDVQFVRAGVDPRTGQKPVRVRHTAQAPLGLSGKKTK